MVAVATRIISPFMFSDEAARVIARASLEEALKPRPIETARTPYGRKILAFCGRWIEVSASYVGNGVTEWVNEDGMVVYPTHWLPGLPDPKS